MAKPNWFKKAITKAKDFLKKTAKDVKKNAKKIVKALKNETGQPKKQELFKPGTLVAFQYDAKHKQQKYDRNPLVLMLGPSKKTKGLYLGLNLHWLPMSDRVSIASFFAELLDKRGGELVYDDIKPFVKKFKGHPVLRSYFYNRVSKQMYPMNTEQYLVAAGVPSEKWMGGK